MITLVSKHCAFGLLSLGVTQTASILGLTFIGLKELVQRTEKVYHRTVLKTLSPKDPAYALRQKKIEVLEVSLRRDAMYAKTFGWMLIPLIGASLTERYGSFKEVAISAIEELLKHTPILNRYLKQLGHRKAYPLNHKKIDLEKFTEKRSKTLKELPEAAEMKLKTRDGREVDALFISQEDQTAPFALLFHGNAMTLDGMVPWAKYYQKRGFNVLLVTMGGYPGSPQGTKTSESTTYRDAQAAADFALSKTQAPKKIVAHGLSIGSSLALQAAVAHPGIHVVADQTFTRLSQISENLFILPKAWILRSAFQASLTAGEVKAADFATDGLNNAEKVKRIQGTFFSLYSENDTLVNPKGGIHMPLQLAKNYLAGHKPNRLTLKEITAIIPKGVHGQFFGEGTVAAKTLEGHLQSIGLITRKKEFFKKCD